MVKRIDDVLSYADEGQLRIEECTASDLAERFGTPLYVISEAQLRRNARHFREAFAKRWPDGTVNVLPAIKANYCLALRRILTEEGCGCDLFSEGELWAALECGVDPALMSLNGNSKLGVDSDLLRTAVEHRVRITLDDAEEFDAVEEVAKALGKKARIRFRLRPEYRALRAPSEFLAELIPTELATQAYKSGVPTEDLIPLGRRALTSEHVAVTGVHIHQGRHRRDLKFWKGTIEGLVALLALLKKEWDGWEPAEIDVGGGFATPRDPLGREIDRTATLTTGILWGGNWLGSQVGRLRHRILRRLIALQRSPGDRVGSNPLVGKAPTVEEYAEVVTTTLRTELGRRGLDPQGKTLEVEPGRGLYGDAGLHLARVTFIKRQKEPIPWVWVNTDTTESFLSDQAAEHSRLRYLVADKPIDGVPEDRRITADIVGRSCNPDRIIGDASLPATVSPGDVIAFLDTGAYQDAAAANFNALPRPATVLVHGAEAEVIKRAEQVADVFARDIVPDRLRG
jgi:diaminopimelate decarboxylase